MIEHLKRLNAHPERWVILKLYEISLSIPYDKTDNNMDLYDLARETCELTTAAMAEFGLTDITLESARALLARRVRI